MEVAEPERLCCDGGDGTAFQVAEAALSPPPMCVNIFANDGELPGGAASGVGDRLLAAISRGGCVVNPPLRRTVLARAFLTWVSPALDSFSCGTIPSLRLCAGFVAGRCLLRARGGFSSPF